MNSPGITERMKEIEDRKIEILLETGKLNNRYSETIERLNKEYEELNKEYFELKIKLMNKNT